MAALLCCNSKNVPTFMGIFLFLLFLYYVLVHRPSQIFKDNEGRISVREMVSSLQQDDPRIVKYIRDNHLTPASELPYHLDKPNEERWDVNGVSKQIERILKQKKSGFFIEAGSHEGERMSSTLHFEKYHNWTGLCVEPSPLNILLWKKKNRKAWLADVCLSTSKMPMVVDFFHNHKDTMGSQIGDKQAVMGKPGDWVNFKIPCFPIFSLLKAVGVDSVDFFNLDVEGVEFEVLKTIPFQEILIRTLSVEIHVKDAHARVYLAEQIKEYLAAQGFNLEFEDLPESLIFAHKSLKEEN